MTNITKKNPGKEISINFISYAVEYYFSHKYDEEPIIDSIKQDKNKFNIELTIGCEKKTIKIILAEEEKKINQEFKNNVIVTIELLKNVIFGGKAVIDYLCYIIEGQFLICNINNEKQIPEMIYEIGNNLQEYVEKRSKEQAEIQEMILAKNYDEIVRYYFKKIYENLIKDSVKLYDPKKNLQETGEIYEIYEKTRRNVKNLQETVEIGFEMNGRDIKFLLVIKEEEINENFNKKVINGIKEIKTIAAEALEVIDYYYFCYITPEKVIIYNIKSEKEGPERIYEEKYQEKQKSIDYVVGIIQDEILLAKSDINGVISSLEKIYKDITKDRVKTELDRGVGYTKLKRNGKIKFRFCVVVEEEFNEELNKKVINGITIMKREIPAAVEIIDYIIFITLEKVIIYNIKSEGGAPEEIYEKKYEEEIANINYAIERIDDQERLQKMILAKNYPDLVGYYFKKICKNIIKDSVKIEDPKKNLNEKIKEFGIERNGRDITFLSVLLEEEFNEEFNQKVNQGIKEMKTIAPETAEVIDYFCYITSEKIIIYNIKSEKEGPEGIYEEKYQEEERSIEIVIERIDEQEEIQKTILAKNYPPLVGYYFKKIYKNLIKDSVKPEDLIKKLELDVKEKMRSIGFEKYEMDIFFVFLEEEFNEEFNKKVNQGIKEMKTIAPETAELRYYFCYITPEKIIIYNIKSEKEGPEGIYEEKYQEEERSIEIVIERIYIIEMKLAKDYRGIVDHYFEKIYQEIIKENAIIIVKGGTEKFRFNENPKGKKFEMQLGPEGENIKSLLAIVEEEFNEEFNKKVINGITEMQNEGPEVLKIRDYFCYLTPKRFIMYNIKSERGGPEEIYEREDKLGREIIKILESTIKETKEINKLLPKDYRARLEEKNKKK
jgi:hypothetical protein